MVVGASDTAVALGSGDVPVLGTPRLVALMEAAAVAGLAELLEPETTSVGTRIDIAHVASSSVGDEVVATAEVVARTDRRVTFAVTARSGAVVVGEGTHVRALVGRDRFPG